ncbi:hypothetical protein [Acrocarpospora sp. B8E8]|uniref:hypothetical protein n=1 Tax=Acrocarpospora sp. B8E8 TaxID=3153572 RepID=UPI00325D873C
MNTDLSVFVVQVEPTGLWETGCCNSDCLSSYGFHCVAEDLASEAEAEKAATRHRAEIRRAAKEERVQADHRHEALRLARTEAGRAALVEELVQAKARIRELTAERDELRSAFDRERENSPP